MNHAGLRRDGWWAKGEPTHRVSGFEARVGREIGLRGSKPALQNKPNREDGLRSQPSTRIGKSFNCHNQVQNQHRTGILFTRRVSNTFLFSRRAALL